LIHRSPSTAAARPPDDDLCTTFRSQCIPRLKVTKIRRKSASIFFKIQSLHEVVVTVKQETGTSVPRYRVHTGTHRSKQHLYGNRKSGMPHGSENDCELSGFLTPPSVRTGIHGTQYHDYAYPDIQMYTTVSIHILHTQQFFA
jgi:hypothetical protein